MSDIVVILFPLIMLYCVVNYIVKTTSGSFDLKCSFLMGFAIFCLLDAIKYFGGVTRVFRGDEWYIIQYLLILVVAIPLFLISYKISFFSQIDCNVVKIRYSNVKIDYLVLPLTGLLLLVYMLFRNEYGSYFGIVGYYLKASIIFFFAIMLKMRKIRYALLVVLLIVLGVDDTSRRAYVVIFIPMLMIFISDWNQRRYISALKMKILVSVLFVVLFVFLNYLRSDHDFGDGYVKGDKVGNTISYIRDLKSVDTFYNTVYIFENFPGRFKYYLGETYLSVFVGLIPRSIWPSKPVGLAAPLGLMQLYGVQEFDMNLWIKSNQYSLSPGLVGEAHANFGYFGAVFIFVALGVIAKFFDARYKKRIMIGEMYSLHILPVFPTFMLLSRGDFYSAVLYGTFVSLFVYCMVRIVRKDIM